MQPTETSSSTSSTSSTLSSLVPVKQEYFKRVEDVDRLLTGMTHFFLAGAFGGSVLATMRGLPLRKTAFSTATSCALVGAACFGMERIADITLRYTIGPPVSSLDEENRISVNAKSMRMYATHAWGGAVGGAIVGTVFHAKTIPGMLLFSPIMVLYAYGEVCYEEKRQEKLEQRLRQMSHQQQEPQDIPGGGRGKGQDNDRGTV